MNGCNFDSQSGSVGTINFHSILATRGERLGLQSLMNSAACQVTHKSRAIGGGLGFKASFIGCQPGFHILSEFDISNDFLETGSV